MNWKTAASRKPLLLRGARQVGKTYAVRKRARRFAHFAEVDFVVQRGDRIVPIEVKAGGTGRMKSLHMFMEEKKSARGLRLSLEDFSRVGDVLIRPLYAAGMVLGGI